MLNKITKVINGVEKDIYLSYNSNIRQYQLNPIKLNKIDEIEPEQNQIVKSEKESRAELYKLKIAVEILEAKKSKTPSDIMYIKKIQR